MPLARGPGMHSHLGFGAPYLGARLVPIAAVLAVAVANLPAAEGDPGRSRDRVHSRARLASGVLSTPSNASAAEIARRYVRASSSVLGGVDSDTLSVRRVVGSARGGSVVSMRQTYRGLDVVGGAVSVRTDARGRVRWMRSRLADLDRPIPSEPVVEGAELDAALREQMPVANLDDQLEGARERLVVFARGVFAASPRLAWEVRFPMNAARASAPIAYVDARDGTLLGVADQVRHHQHRALAYEFNPEASEGVIEVALPSLPAEATRLEDPQFAVSSCVDRNECVETRSGSYSYKCFLEQRAVAGDDGSFIHIEPGDDNDPEDPFAEVQAYYHARKAYDMFAAVGVGVEALEALKLEVIANGRQDRGIFTSVCDGEEVTGGATLETMENAYFSPVADPGMTEGPHLMLGQGMFEDYAYDGDVVYHEMGHAVIHAVAPEFSRGTLFIDEYGLTTAPGAINEGTSDYFSSVITGDPSVGEYVGPIRELDHEKRAPHDFSGQVHNDGEPWGAALWTIRNEIAEEERALLDAAVLRTLAGLPEDVTFCGAAELLVSELEASHPPAVDIAREELDRRGLLTCERVVPLGGDATMKRVRFAGREPVAPTIAQFSVTLDEPRERIVVDIGGYRSYGIGEDDHLGYAALKSGGEPIMWATTDFGLPDADSELVVDIEADEISSDEAFPARAVFEGSFEPGTYHVQLVGQADALGSLFGFSTTLEDIAIRAGGGDGDEKDDSVGAGSGARRVGCAVGASRGGGAAPALALALALAASAGWRRRVSKRPFGRREAIPGMRMNS